MATVTPSSPRGASKTRKTRQNGTRRATPARSARAAAPARRPPDGHARRLVIVESPAKARTIENILGADYRVIASVGHVRDLPNFGYGVEDFENFRPRYVIVKDKRRDLDKSEIVGEIRDAAEDAEKVYLSTDPDREGEAIAWHIRESAHIPADKTRRVIFHEITRPAIEAAFAAADAAEQRASAPAATPHERAQIDEHLVDAQQARRVLDRLIGYPLTWFVQNKVSRGATAGRVQSVALGLIVEREREIQQFTPVEYWTVHSRLARAAAEFEAELARFPGAPPNTSLKPPFRAAGPSIPDQSAADTLVAAIRRCDFTVSTVRTGQRSAAPAPPFTTSTFQQAAGNRLGMSTQRAMSIAQQLYEGISGQSGLITYMRTDSLTVAPTARHQARDYIAGRWGADYVPEKERIYRTTARAAQEAHEAIRPTDATRTPESLRGTLSPEQMRVYTLIWQRFLASQMTDARYATMTVEVLAHEGQDERGTFRASAQQLVFPGHLAVYRREGDDTADSDDQATSATLPALQPGDSLTPVSVDPRQHHTEPPPRYTEASLVKALEEDGIGRPSTYATIVQTVQKRDYVRKEGRQLIPQALGFLVHDLLEQYMKKYVDVPFTGAMEQELDQIAAGAQTYVGVLKEFWPEFKKQLDAADILAEKQEEQTDILCDVCKQANLVIKWGRNGRFFACPRFPECKNSLPMGPDGKPLHVPAPAVSEYRCPIDGAATIQKNGPYGAYLECVNREKGTCTFRSGVPVGVPCPEEPETGQLVEKRTRRGVFYGCWNYPHCSYTTNSLEPGKMTPPRPPAEREAANRQLMERSARGKAAFAKRRENRRTLRNAS